MKLSQQQTALLAIAAAIIIAIAGYALSQSTSKNGGLSDGNGAVSEPGATAGDSTVPTPNSDTTTTTGTTGTTAKPPAGNTAVTQSYADAYKIYAASGFRYQFVNCSGDPGSMVVKTGQKFMMDNRDNKSHKFVVQGKAITIGNYGFAVITAGKVGTSKITCDGGGAADLIVSR